LPELLEPIESGGLRRNMSSQKKRRQHFVPQFLLRNFSKNKKSINQYSINNKKFIKQSAIKGQCQKKYFYGENEQTENAFSKMEYIWHSVIETIIRKKILPPKNSLEWVSLLFFTVAQKNRVEDFLNLQKNIHSMLSDIYSDTESKLNSQNQINVFKDSCNLRDPNDIFMDENLKTSLRSFPIISDLSIKILHCKENFFVSDNPVVHTSFCNYEGIWEKPSLGLQSRGLIIFLPLSPSLQLTLYDKAVYKIGNKKELFLEINNVTSRSLNELQFLQGIHSIYYLDSTLKTEIENLSIKYPKSYKTNLISISNHKEYRESITMFQKINPFLGKKPDFVKFTRKNMTNSSATYPRNVKLSNLSKHFDLLDGENKYSVNEFDILYHDFISGNVRK
jgi:hypothetical protein